MQRTTVSSTRDFLLSRSRGAQRFVARHGNESADLGVEAIDAIENRLRELDRREPASFDQRSCLRQRQIRQVRWLRRRPHGLCQGERRRGGKKITSRQLAHWSLRLNLSAFARRT